MKAIHLLRHAKSSWDDSALSDHDRPLNRRGQAACQLMARHFAQVGLRPDLILCSSALRARQTLDALRLDAVPVRVEDGLYSADALFLLERLRRLPEENGSILLVGHNPALGQLAARLLAAENREPAAARLRDKYPTGTLASFESPAERWREVTPGTCRLLAFLRPADLGGEPE